MNAAGNISGLIEFIPENVEKAPEDLGVFLIISSSQKVLYVGTTDAKGLRESLWNVLEEQPFGAPGYFKYVAEPDSEKVDEITAELIAEHKPPHNLGYGRFRNEEITLPKQGHSIRHSAPNP